MYESGSFATLGKELAVYLTRVGKFPDTMERLVKRHLDKGDEIAAFVARDLYGRFRRGDRRTGISVRCTRISGGTRRRATRRDSHSRIARGGHFGDVSVEECAARSGWAGMSVDEIKAVVETRRGPNRNAFDGPKTDEQLAEEEATVLLDKVAAGEMQVTEITQRLAECYSNSDRPALAKLRHELRAL